MGGGGATKRVLVAFSGGIDSYTAVEILKSDGYQVVAMMLDMYGDQQSIEQARRRADELGVEFFVEQVQKEFQEGVIDYFLGSYLNGETPAPCTLCNLKIKWSRLYEIATERGFDHIASGHYFGIQQHDGLRYITKAKDSTKDQSYYLWMIPQHILAMALTPMQGVIKRKVIEQKDWKIGESMGVCFLRGSSCSEYLKQQRGEQIKRGEIVDQDGNCVGSHNGVAYYTIGQKKGLEFHSTMPENSCVIGMDRERNEVVAGSREELYHRTLVIGDVNFVDEKIVVEQENIEVVVRGFGVNPKGFGTVSSMGNGEWKIELEDPAWAPAKGQPIVLYRRGMVVGGGFLRGSF